MRHTAHDHVYLHTNSSLGTISLSAAAHRPLLECTQTAEATDLLSKPSNRTTVSAERSALCSGPESGPAVPHTFSTFGRKQAN